MPVTGRTCAADGAVSRLPGAVPLGHLIVAEKAATDVAAAFKEIYDTNSFRIERMELVDKYGGDDDQSMAANNTSAFNCRPVTTSLKPRSHAGDRGRHQPRAEPAYHWGCENSLSVTKPDAGRPYNLAENRSGDVTGIIVPRGAVTEAFKKRQWSWGGNGNYITDYKHFSQSGR